MKTLRSYGLINYSLYNTCYIFYFNDIIAPTFSKGLNEIPEKLGKGETNILKYQQRKLKEGRKKYK